MNSERELTGDWSNPVEVVLTDVTWEQATKTHYDIIQQKTIVSSEYLHRVHLVLPPSLHSGHHPSLHGQTKLTATEELRRKLFMV